jgi:AAA+ ATPase superfamily predicted ATPase
MIFQGDSQLVDRERELDALQRLAKRDQPALALVYGRRRVGKTFLLDRAWPDREPFYFLAANSTAELNRTELLRELARWSNRPLDPADFPTWRTVFRLLVDFASERPLIVVLDEFQYLFNQVDDIASQLVAVWDRELHGRPLLLVLSGSEVAAMEGLASGSQPLYGRFTLALKLSPFDYQDASRMLPGRTPREAAVLYGALGGLPRYLAAVDPGAPVAAEITRLLLPPTGEVALQVEHVVDQEQGIRNPAEYQAVLAAVAGGATLISEIAQRAGLDDRAVRRGLEVLERLDLVWRERNFDAPPKAPWRFRLADNAVRFWYRFAHANRSRLAMGEIAEVWTERVAPLLDDYMGKTFESICRDAFRRRHAAWGLPGATHWARWEGQDRSRRPIEIDLVARLDDGRVLTGEIKWSSRPLGGGVHTHLLRNLEDLANSGQGWAKDALSPDHSAGHIFFAAGGYDDAFRRLAHERTDIQLVTLDDLYPGTNGAATLYGHVAAPPDDARREESP